MLHVMRTNEQEVGLAKKLQGAGLRKRLSQHSEDIDARTSASSQHQRLASLCSAHSFHTHTWLLENEPGGM